VARGATLDRVDDHHGAVGSIVSRTTPTLRTHSYAELMALKRSVPCPKCCAPVGCPCADFRSWDKYLYGVRVHVERDQARRNE
jgi:hypothetical protein